MNFTLLGAEWVLWLLIILSILSIGVMIERALFFSARQIDSERLVRDVRSALSGGDADAFLKRYRQSEAMAARVAVSGVAARDRGADAVSELMYGAKVSARGEHERFLVVLGTLGNNAPFIGLFGTVLGIIQAFSDLSENAQGGAEVVMGGISEALVATAVGLLVAIPAVVAFNYFNRRLRAALTGADEVAHAVLGHMRGDAHEQKGAA